MLSVSTIDFDLFIICMDRSLVMVRDHRKCFSDFGFKIGMKDKLEFVWNSLTNQDFFFLVTNLKYFKSYLSVF